MIKNLQIESINKTEIKFQWEWVDSDDEINIYLQKYGEKNKEKLGTQLQMGEIAYAEKTYEVKKMGLYKIIVFEVIRGKESEKPIGETDYFYVGNKNILEYNFEDANDMDCYCINIQRLDRPIQKEFVYLTSVLDQIKIPFTYDLHQGQKFYISNYGDLNIELKYPYNIEVELRRI